MAKFETHSDAVKAAIAHNIAINGGGSGSGYIINKIKGVYNGFDFIPGWYEACAQYEGGSHHVRPI